MNNPKPAQPAQTWQSCQELVNARAVHPDSLVLQRQGDTAVVVFAGEPFAFEAVWEEANGWVPWNPHHDLHRTIEPCLRILINCVVISENNGVVHNRAAYWEMGVATFKTLCRLRDRRGLDDWLYCIERLDADDAEPGYSIEMDRKLDPELRSKLACVPRICLAAVKGLAGSEGA
jgi:hypothetical protein